MRVVCISLVGLNQGGNDGLNMYPRSDKYGLCTEILNDQVQLWISSLSGLEPPVSMIKP
jgi:hypothetical protein